MSRKVLYIHAGGVKTGSSALQSFLDLNAESLGVVGIAYENRMGIVNPYEITSGNGGALYEALASGETGDNVIDEIVMTFFGSHATAICSSELFTHLNCEAWRQLAGSAERLGIEFHVVFLVRDVLPFLMSSYDQMIKRHGEWRDFAPWAATAAWQHADALKALASVIPASKIRVVSYDGAKATFLKTCLTELGVPQEFEVDSRDESRFVNRSLTGAERGVLLSVNRVVGGEYSQELSDLMIYASPERRPSSVVCDDETVALLRARFASDVDWINSTFEIKAGEIAIDALEGTTRDGCDHGRGEEKIELDDEVAAAVMQWILKKLPSFQDRALDRIEKALQRRTSFEADLSLPGDFDPLAYLLLNRDVFFAQIDPIQHFVNYGRAEGRRYAFETVNSAVQSTMHDKENAILTAIFNAHKGNAADKWTSYFGGYARYFSKFRDQSIRLLEIGVQNGGSLEIWQHYFSNADRIVGCDINALCNNLTFSDSKISIVVADANSDVAYEQILACSTYYDLIIDDGSHTSHDIIQSFCRYFPILSDGGLFFIEDLHCSYWQEYGGGISHPRSSIAFFKALVDIVNHEHWGVSRSRKELLTSFSETYGVVLDDSLLAHIHSVEFFNSCCVIRKAIPAANVLGRRCVAGSTAIVCPEVFALHGTEKAQSDEAGNTWSLPTATAQERLFSELEASASLREHIGIAESTIAAFEAERARWRDEARRMASETQLQINQIHSQVLAREEGHSERMIKLQEAHASQLIDTLQHSQLREDELRRFFRVDVMAHQNTSQLLQKRHKGDLRMIERLEARWTQAQDDHEAAFDQWKAEREELKRLHEESGLEYRATVELLKGVLASMESSRIWRWSKPFRSFGEFLAVRRPQSRSQREH
ncbi:class I SAM-dependent methyltransferase [Paraburkholderia sediminicola]|uniref:hypothetical protein n=1 Tax=Paraburkholderia sediminicola TaxID=458836 RepID=UPI0038B75F67